MTFNPQPKPQKRKKEKKWMKRWKRPAKTDAASQHLADVKSCNCVNCGAPAPSDAHHTRSDHFGRPRASDWATIPLCKLCHDLYHGAKTVWENLNCKDYAYIPQVLKWIYGPRWNIDH